MNGRNFERHRDILQEKYHTLLERLANLQQELVTTQQQLTTLTQSIQADRLAVIQAKREALEQLRQTPPARHRHEDKARHATASIRPLTKDELTLAALKGRVFHLIVVALSSHVAGRRSLEVRLLRLHIRRDWEYDVRTLQREVERLEREVFEQRDTTEQRLLRNKIAQIQRDIPQLELQARFMFIEIDALRTN